MPATVSYDAATGKATLKPTRRAHLRRDLHGDGQGRRRPASRAPAGGALAADSTWTFTASPRPPILLVTSTREPVQRLRGARSSKAEGLAGFTTLDLSLLSSTVLTGFDQVVLGDVPLTARRSTMLTNWVNAGGNLIALRPDKQLAGLLGLTDLADALRRLPEGRHRGRDARRGHRRRHDAVPRRGRPLRAQRRDRGRHAVLDATTATTSPAVTLRSVGSNGGQAAAFTYDLARSVVYTRQGNPAWAGQDRDGILPDPPERPVLRRQDGRHPARLGRPQQGRDPAGRRAAAPARQPVTLMGDDRKPVPRFWYLPRG